MRESLRTTNKKLAEELRRRRQVEVEARRLGWEVDGVGLAAAPVTGAGGAATSVASKPALAEVRAEYAAWSLQHKRKRTIMNDRKRLDVFFGTVSGKAVDAITTRDVEAFLTQEAGKGRAPATLLRHREILHAFWRWAERQGHVESNVVAPIPRPRLPERDPVFLNLEQVDELVKAIDGERVGAAIATAVFAGLRREELCWLTWDDLEVDRVPAILRVRAKTVDGESWQPKTKRDRKVPVSFRLLAMLQAQKETWRERGVPWLFPSPDGKRWDPDNLSADIRELLRRHNLRWNLLELRHTFGSQLARKGVSLLKIAKLMGNSPMIASKHYINLVPEEMAGDVEF